MFSDLMLARYIFHAAHCETRQATTEQLSAPTYSGWTSFDHGYGYAGAKYVPTRFPPFARSPPPQLLVLRGSKNNAVCGLPAAPTQRAYSPC